jgi:hypothetical protein
MTMPDHYRTLPAALAYHDARGNGAWTAAGVDDAKRNAGLVRASEALDALYGARYPGSIPSADQDLLWPRADVVWGGEELAADIVPAPIEKAICELALRELAKPASSHPMWPPARRRY